METYLFTSELRDVLTAARMVARRRQDQCVATEHYLLTLVEDPPQAVASIFEELWLDRAVCRSSAQQAVPQNAPPLDQSDLPYTRGAAALVDQVGELATKLGKAQAGPEHLLLALATTTDGATRSILERAGASADAITAFLRRRDG